SSWPERDCPAYRGPLVEVAGRDRPVVCAWEAPSVPARDRPDRCHGVAAGTLVRLWSPRRSARPSAAAPSAARSVLAAPAVPGSEFVGLPPRTGGRLFPGEPHR